MLGSLLSGMMLVPLWLWLFPLSLVVLGDLDECTAVVLPEYGDCVCVCEFGGAYLWFVERSMKLSTAHHPRYGHYYKSGDVILPYPFTLPIEYIAIFDNVRFLRDIIAYNSMFSMTLFGANVDEDLNDSRGPYVFKVSGQISHKIQSFTLMLSRGLGFFSCICLTPRMRSRFRTFDNPKKRDLDEGIVTFLVAILKGNNEYMCTFKTAKQFADEMNVTSYAVRLFNNVPNYRYDQPSPGSMGCIVTGDDTNCRNYDIVVHSNSGRP